MSLRTRYSCLVLLALLLFSVQAANAQIMLRFGHTNAPQDTINLGAEYFAKRVAEKTNNAIRVQVFPAGQLGNDQQVLDGVRFGTIDIGMTGNPFFTTLVPELNLFDLPYLFRDYHQAYSVLDGPIGVELRSLLEKHGMTPLGILEIGFRNITNNKRQVKEPGDVKGLRIRTTPNLAHIQAFRLLGADPVPMPFPEVYLALSTGTVDGEENPIELIYNSKFYEVQKYLSLTEHAYTCTNVVMNLKEYQALKPEYQKALLEAMQEARDWQRRLNRQVEGKNLAAMKAAGMQVEENPDRDAFRKIVADPTADEYAKKFGRSFLDRARSTQ